jgi:prevent-host-death family protein
MRTITAMDLRRRLGETLDRAAAGERIVIERDRRPLAVLVPYSEAASSGESEQERLARIDAAFDRLEAFRKRMSQKYPDAMDAAAAVRWDRDHGHSVDRD